MKITQEKLPASQIGLEIEIPAEISKNTYEKVVKEIAKTTNIPGFRKGKIPRPILLQRLGSQRIKGAVLEELIQESIQKAVEQESINVLGNYQLISDFEELVNNYQLDESFTFKASVDVPPEVTLGQYLGLQVQAEEVLYNPEDVDKLIDERRQKLATLIPLENRSAQMGDVAVIDFAGRKPTENEEEGEIIPGTEAKEYQIELAEGKFIPGFLEGVAGMNIGETKKLTLTFPEDYAQEDLAGETVVFTVTLQDLKEKELPELDDDFAKEVSEFETMAQLRESLEKQYHEKAANDTKQSIHAAIVTELLKHTTIDLPHTMLEEEVQNILMQTANQLQSYGMDVNQFFTRDVVTKMRETAKPEASKNLHTTLIIEKIAEQESITVSDEEVTAKTIEIKSTLKERDVDEVKLQKYVKHDLLAEKTLDWLQEKTQVELVPFGSLTKEEESTDEEISEEESNADS
ncbi:MAG: trigger factor [Cyanobacteria bacterium]|nr:trigger factor [Cyanobacteria bacterium CG_2015-16_32_12]NCO77943.1 trigger factor [Cyanobacteria bacterium CG_2015-22_32_23]NCQ05662.1 trigger factor [Cyanobacteria bacterium CG_2015-09_32_10]NCS85531.1 trigger factor [Cyanobacteria bacterium CG_2015-02_32_10]